MASLTKTQLDHAKAKVVQLAQDRIGAFKEKLGPAPKMPYYREEEKLAMVLSGKAKAKSEDGLKGYGYYHQFFDYPMTPAMKSAKASLDAWNAKLTAEQKKVDAIKERVIDALVMSPDGMDALKAIAAAFA